MTVPAIVSSPPSTGGGVTPALKPKSANYYTLAGVTTNASRPYQYFTAHPFVLGVLTTFDRIAVNLAGTAASGSLVRLGIYDDNSGQPGSLVLDAGTIAGDVSTGLKTITISQQLTAGVYWLCVGVQGGVTGPSMDAVSGNQVLGYSPANAGGVLRQGFGWSTGNGPTGAFPGSASGLALGVADVCLLAALRAA